MPTPTVDLHPLLDNVDALAIVNDMLAAQSESEWNSCLARLVTFLFVAATPRREGAVDQAREALLTYKMIQLRAIIERGRKITPNRHAHRLQAREDARNLHIRGAPTFARALDELMGAERTPDELLPKTTIVPKTTFTGQEIDGPTDKERAALEAWRTTRRDVLRKRIERAEKAGGFRLPRRAKRTAGSTRDSNE